MALGAPSMVVAALTLSEPLPGPFPAQVSSYKPSTGLARCPGTGAMGPGF